MSVVATAKEKIKMDCILNLLVTFNIVVSMVLTLVAFFAYCQVKAIAVVWYMVVAAIVLGFLVAYAAMFGFDKLKEALTELNKQ